MDSNSAAANQLAEQLNHSGFHADVASSWPAAQTAARAGHFDAVVMVADLNQTADIECLKHLRKCAPSTWIGYRRSRSDHVRIDVQRPLDIDSEPFLAGDRPRGRAPKAT